MYVVKRNSRVDAEVAALEAVRHPGVVELVDAAEGVVRTHRVDGRPLDGMGPLHPDEVAGVAAAVATTLADLHELGIVHGGIEASHVLVGSDGRIVLCSLGRGGEAADDVAALGRLVTELLATASTAVVPVAPRHRSFRLPGRRRPGRPARLGSLLAPPAEPALTAVVADATAADPARRPTARQVAAAVHQRVPTARLPVPPTSGSVLPRAALPGFAGTGPRPVPWSARTRAVMGALGAVGVVATTVVAWVWVAGRGDVAPTGQATRPPTSPVVTTSVLPNEDATGTAPARSEALAERVWPRPSLEFSDGVLDVDGRRYAVGQRGDRVVAGDWACTGNRTVALLRLTTGEVFAFDEWATEGHDVAGRPLGRVAEAVELKLADGDGDGCDDLEVERAGLPPLAVAVGPTPPPDRAREDHP